MDIADIAGEHDFSAEKLMQQRGRQNPEVIRGKCLSCKAKTDLVEGQPKLYCDDDCREDYEYEQAVRTRTRR
jgi:hypothetical protein